MPLTGGPQPVTVQAMSSQPSLRMGHWIETERLVICPSCRTRLPFRRRDEIWIEVPIEGEWIAAYRIVVRRRRPLVAEVRLFPSPSDPNVPGSWSGAREGVPPGGVPGKALRALRLKDPMGLFPQIVANFRRQHGRAAVDQVLRRFGMSTRSRLVPRRPGQAGRGDWFYAVWAAAYVSLVDAGVRHPVKELAANPPIRVEGYISRGSTVAPETVRAIINDARHRGFLTATPAGKAGGELTPKGKRVLNAPAGRRVAAG